MELAYGNWAVCEGGTDSSTVLWVWSWCSL